MGFAIVKNCEFCCVIGSHWELFRVMNDGIVISDNFCGWVKKFDGGKNLVLFRCVVYGDSVEPNSTFTGVVY